MTVRPPSRVLPVLICPVCQGPLRVDGSSITCGRPTCGQVFPIVDGIPILIDPATSLFSFDEYRGRRVAIVDSGGSRMRRLARAMRPSISRNLRAVANVRWLVGELVRQSSAPMVLVVGGGTVGEGIDQLLANPAITCVETDLSFGPRTQLVCDAHRLPFADGSMDAVIAQAVLEHVLEPQRCVDEIHRVLRDAGIVYCEVPFMQQVHLGRYDFTRFTHGGLRFLFRAFDEIKSGVVCGPGMALAWAWEYFLLSFVKSPTAQRFVRLIARSSAFWLVHCDRVLGDSAGALDAASAYYFVARRSKRSLTGREVTALYSGLQRTAASD